jgi:hypothetical protein
MSLKENVIRIWKNKGQILEGITNSIFKKEDVEQIAKERMSICRQCDLFTEKDAGCVVAGTTPCCDQTKGGCGCSLAFKTRSLSSDCPLGKWKAEITQAEEDFLKSKLGI